MKSFLLRHTRLLTLAATALLIVILLAKPVVFDFQAVNNSSRHYARGIVTSVTKTSWSETSPYSGRKIGSQTVRVKVEGKTVTIENDLSDTHYVRVRKGTRVLVSIDAPKGAKPYYAIFNYDRTAGVCAILAFFAALMLLIGGKKGGYALAALVFAVILILRMTVPSLFNGAPALAVTAAAIVLITLDSILLLQGASKQSVTSILVVFTGELLAAGLFALFSAVLRISGFNDENIDSLLVITQNTGLDLSHILFAAAAIASLGAVMDVAVSLVSAVFEVYAHNQSLSARELFLAGMNVGRDMMGTMSNTLILAFTGSALSMLLVICSYGVGALALLSTDTICVELAHGLCGTAAVILTVPISAAASAIALSGRTRDARKELSESE